MDNIVIYLNMYSVSFPEIILSMPGYIKLLKNAFKKMIFK